MSNYSHYGSNVANIVQTEDGQTTTQVSDFTSEQLLNNILIELKKINFHLSIVNGGTVKDVEVE